jgi:hypothetical protein
MQNAIAPDGDEKKSLFFLHLLNFVVCERRALKDAEHRKAEL